MTTQRKPSFNVSQDGRTVEVDGTVYSLNPQGLRNIPELIKSDFKGFRKPSFNELLSLVRSSDRSSLRKTYRTYDEADYALDRALDIIKRSYEEYSK